MAWKADKHLPQMSDAGKHKQSKKNWCNTQLSFGARFEHIKADEQGNRPWVATALMRK